MASVNPRIVIVLVLLGFILFYPNGPANSPEQTRQIKVVVESERVSLQVLRDSNLTDFDHTAVDAHHWLDLAGFREPDAYAWDLLETAKQAARAQIVDAIGLEDLDSISGTAQGKVVQYHNITGNLKGEWSRTPLPEGYALPQVNLSVVAANVTYYSSYWERNVTANTGKVSFRIEEREQEENNDVAGQEDVHEISATMMIQESGTEWQARLHGVHFASYGGLLLTTTSEKFAGIFGLPHFALSPATFEQSRTLLNQSLTETIAKQEQDPDNASRNPWRSASISEEGTAAAPLCELIVHLQAHAVDLERDAGNSDPRAALDALEYYIRHPEDGPLSSHVPDIQMSMVAFSPDCGFIIQSKGPPDVSPQIANHLQGPKIEVFISTSKKIILTYILVLAMQLTSLIRQIRMASTPSTKSRLSFYTLELLLLGDACTWVVFLTVAFFLDSFTLLLMVVAFLEFMQGGFFGMKFLMDIWSVQESERNEWTTSNRGSPARTTSPPTVAPEPEVPPPVEDTPGPGELPLPVTAQRHSWAAATPFLDRLVAPPVDDIPPTGNNTRRSFGSLYTRFYLLLLFIVFLSLNAASSWPPLFRSIYANTLAFIYLSCWIPQIYRNIVRNCRKALTWEFVLAQSTFRLLPIAYFWGISSNFLDAETDVYMLLALASWLWLQILILAAQEMLGPRFLVSESWRWVPPAWDYHPILKDDDESGNMPIGFSSSPPSPADERVALLDGRAQPHGETRSIRIYECAICMQQIDVPVLATGVSESRADGFANAFGGGLLARRGYMVTPCRHVFHTPCLESWLSYRLQCPICREDLPPL